MRRCASSARSIRPRSAASSWSAIAASMRAIDKSLEVRNTGGTGMVLVNTSANSASMPTCTMFRRFISTTSTRTAVVAYVRRPGRERQRTPSPGRDTASAGARYRGVQLARSRSRDGGDILKPDVMAPGVDIAAGVAPPDLRRTTVRLLVRHIDVEPARCRSRRAAEAGASGLVTGDDPLRAR